MTRGGAALGCCGHDCDGGACEDASCVPLPAGVLATGQYTPSAIVVDSENVYWINAGTPVGGHRENPPTYVGAQLLRCTVTVREGELWRHARDAGKRSQRASGRRERRAERLLGRVPVGRPRRRGSLPMRGGRMQQQPHDVGFPRRAGCRARREPRVFHPGRGHGHGRADPCRREVRDPLFADPKRHAFSAYARPSGRSAGISMAARSATGASGSPSLRIPRLTSF